jgi:hypothetical protein
MMTALASLPVRAQDDAPDLGKESRFHRIYEKYNTQPTDSQKWDTAVGKTQTQRYDVQKGDTLWDISDTLFADPGFWPKVWSLNVHEIGNPHEISVGQRIKFTPGTAGEPPQLAVTNAKTDKDADEIGGDAAKWMEDEPPQKTITFDLSKVVIPPPAHPPRPVVDLPKSLPNWTYKGIAKNEVDMELQSPRRDFGHPPEILTWYIDDVAPQPVGKIVEAETGITYAADYQYVVVQLPDNPTEKKFLVVKNAGTLTDPISGQDGSVVHIEGELEVLQQVNADRHLYRAMVTRSTDLVEVGAGLIPGSIPSYTTQADVAKSAADALVIGVAGGMNRTMFSSNNVVFLTGGNGKGMVPGSVYPIFKNQSLRTKTKEVQAPLEIGHVKILKTSNNFATGVIVDSTEEMLVGDGTSNVVDR